MNRPKHKTSTGNKHKRKDTVKHKTKSMAQSHQEDEDLSDVCHRLELSDQEPDGGKFRDNITILRILHLWPDNWIDCITLKTSLA